MVVNQGILDNSAGLFSMPEPKMPVVLVTCGSRLRGPIAAQLVEYGFEVGDATTLLEPNRLRAAELVRTVIVSLDPARSRSGLAILAAARRHAPFAQRILIAPRNSRLIRPAMLTGLVHRTWLLPVGARLSRLLESVRSKREDTSMQLSDHLRFAVGGV
jgi:hypothetical protein